MVLDGNEPMESYQGGVGWGAGVIGKTPVVLPFQALYINPRCAYV